LLNLRASTEWSRIG